MNCYLDVQASQLSHALHFFSQVVFYCHFPDLLLAKHSTVLRRIYRKPIDLIEEITTGLIPCLYFLLL